MKSPKMLVGGVVGRPRSYEDDQDVAKQGDVTFFFRPVRVSDFHNSDRLSCWEDQINAGNLGDEP